jgi:hypothetical protein
LFCALIKIKTNFKNTEFTATKKWWFFNFNEDNHMSEQLIHLNEAQNKEIEESRIQLTNMFVSPGNGHVIIAGPCSITNQEDIIRNDGRKLNVFANSLQSSMLLRRLNPWKPRSSIDDWHGEETTDIESVRNSLAEVVGCGNAVTFELGKKEHFVRYGQMLTMAWGGSRNSNDYDFLCQLVSFDPSLPVGIKNDLSGDIVKLLETIKSLQIHRSQADAPILPIFRGGTLLPDPKKWGEAFKRISSVTGGRFIVDAAHGSEMAHDPNQLFQKTIAGQLRALSHIQELNMAGNPSIGIMVEASDIISRTDPNIPLDFALHKLRKFI